MVLKVLRFVARRLGPRYPGAIVLAQLSLAHFIVLGGLGLLTIYQPMSAANFWRLLAAAEALVFIDNMFSAKVAFHMLRPVRAWLGGERNRQATLEAWRAL